MLQIVSGSIDKVKAEMKQHVKSISFEIKSIKKTYNEKAREMNKKAKESKDAGEGFLVEDKMIIQIYQKRMDELEKKKQFYNSSIVPVKVDGIIINFKAYEDFMKILAGFSLHIMIEPDKLVVHYWKTSIFGAQPKGRLELYDLSTHFEDYNSIPVADNSHEVESYGA